LTKGAQQIAHNIVLMQEEIGRLQDAVKALTKRKTRKRRYVRAEETLIVGEVANLVTKREVDSRDDSREPLKRVRVGRRCGRCSKIRHNSCTYKVEIEDVYNSDTSK
jgi:hypothetical protein